jgi:subtilisin family serine protease
MKKYFFLMLTVLLVFAGCSKDPAVEREILNDDIIKGKFIVVFDTEVTGKAFLKSGRDFEGTKEYARELASSVLEETSISKDVIEHVYGFALDGFSARLTDEEFVRLRNDKRVKYIEPDRIMRISGSQSSATWGIDRVDQRDLPLNQTYTWDATGTGVKAYIIDTGIRYDHVEFGGRASFGFDAFGGNGLDGNGHGTHVAGTVGGNTYGVAKNVSLIAVRVLDNSGSGSTTGVVAGMDWVAANHVKPAVANMSLGGGASTAIDDAVANMYDAGVPVIVAAGNGNRAGRQDDACKYSPARAPKAYTIGATTSTDAKASYSNYGNCVDLFAPGSSITSAWYTSSTAINTISGTSMASPHVAGGAALFLEKNPSATAQQVYDAVTTNSTKNKVTSSSTTNNHLLYTLNFGGTAPPPENQAPVASFTFTTNNLTASFDANGSDDLDGNIVSYAWTFGDGSTGSGVTTSRTYAAAGTYEVTLTVTDDDGATGTQSKSVTVTEPASGDDVAPVINTFNVTKSNAGPWRKAVISWAVSDANGDLSSVRLELLSGTTVLESANISVSGSTASGSNELKSRTQPDAVKIIVTDSKGLTATETLPY